MKNVLDRSLLIAALALALTGCGKNNPKDVAQTWLTAFYHMDADPALKLSTPATRNLINTLSALSGDIPADKQEELNKIKVTIKDVKENGDNAAVTYTTTEDPKKELTLNLVRQSDKWLVQFTKTDLGNQMDSENMEEEPLADPASTDTVQPAPAEAGQ
ncbi:hypothetical protein GCM10023093_18160 [Nemorincola caseinilytica]|uniref:DUF4878 domain-containing protein n=1 Tax=Nemorincola caseinilytica TaxID=2054315 RepID=A0ABP8NGT6_9BACT